MRAAVVITLALAVAAAAGLWLAAGQGTTHDGVRLAAPAASAPARRPVPAVAPAASPVASPPVAAARPASAASSARDTHALCDGGPLPLPDGPSREAALAERLQPQRAAFLRAAAAQDDPLVKGLAAFRTEPGTADVAAVRAARDALAEAAVREDDPRLYALAWAACKRVPAGDAGSCQLLSVRRWAQLAPGDARPWLEMAAAARARRDDGELNEALYQVSQARRLDSHRTAIGELALQAMPAGLPRWSQMQLLLQAVRLEQAARPSYAAVLQHCNPRELDANRRQECGAIVDLLQRDAATLTDLRVVAALGRQLGWPTERLRAVNEELDAAQRWIRQSREGRALDCAGVARLRPEIEAVARLGELGALRQRRGR